MSDDDLEYGDDSDYEEEYDALIQFDEPKRESAIQVLEEDQLLKQQNEIVTMVAQLLNVTPGAAAAILRHFRWNYDELSQKYFEDEEKLRSSLGLDIGTARPYVEGQAGTLLECRICYDDVPGDEALALKCDHFFCNDCWGTYLIGKVEEGPSCVHAHCPEPKCWQAVDEIVFEKLLPKEQYERYRKYILRSFVEDNPTIRWCPGPNCNKAVQCQDTKKLFVPCLCGFRFCFRCGEAAHAPVQCDKLREWLMKEKGEGDNMKWLFVNTKPCPNCQSPIQKNDGCNHMTCSKCKWEFCWMCLGDWSKHGESSGGFYKCNYYDPEKNIEIEKEKGEARGELGRYVWYYTRYQEHQKSKEFNQDDLKKAEEKADFLQKSTAGVKGDYVVDAVQQLIENRSMLQYTYVYAYFLPPGDAGKDLFEFLQNMLEVTTENFNTLLKKLLAEENADVIMSNPEFSRKKVADMTAMARDQLHKLLKGVFSEEEALTMAEPRATVRRPPTRQASRSRSNPASKIPDYALKMKKLKDMGYSDTACAEALLAAEGDVDNALQSLLAA